MLALALVLVLSQTAPSAAAQRFDAERGPLLQALAAQYGCDKPGAKREPLCDVARADREGTVADITTPKPVLGVSWNVRLGRAGRVEVGPPRVSALTLRKDSVGVWGGLLDDVAPLAPQNSVERRKLVQLARDYVALLQGRRKGVELPCYLPGLLMEWAKRTHDFVEPRAGAWAFKGTPPNVLRRLGPRWVRVAAPPSGEGLVVSVFAP